MNKFKGRDLRMLYVMMASRHIDNYTNYLESNDLSELDVILDITTHMSFLAPLGISRHPLTVEIIDVFSNDRNDDIEILKYSVPQMSKQDLESALTSFDPIIKDEPKPWELKHSKLSSAIRDNKSQSMQGGLNKGTNYHQRKR